MALSLRRPAPRGCSRKRQAGYIRGGVFAALFGSPKWTPAKLFANREQGVWFDPSDFSTMFQDSAGTTPVTAVEQPVGLLLDKSGRGNHATQATTANRPVLSARYNRLTKAEQFSDVVWSKTSLSATATSATTSPRGDNTASLVIPDTSNNGHLVSYNSAFGTVQMTFSVYAKMAGYPRIGMRVYDGAAYRIRQTFELSNGTVVADGSAAGTPTITSVGNGWYRCSVTSTVPTGSLGSVSGWVIESLPAGALVQAIFTGDGVSGAYLWGADVRASADAALSLPAYQRVNTSTDYDTVGFPPYLAFNGTNSSLATASIDFTSTAQMTVWAGVTKNSDAATAILAELTTSGGATNGGMYVSAPNGAAAGNYGFTAMGSTQAATQSATPFAAPIASVLSVAYDNNQATTALQNKPRVNGVTPTLAALTGPTGAGNFANAPLYLGARAGSSLFFNGRIYSLIVRGALSVAAQITNAERSVGSKMGIAL